MAVLHATDATFSKLVSDSTLPIMVDFWAPWCGPCKMLSPILDEIATDMEGQVLVIKVDVDENPEVSQKYGVQSLPTLAIFKNGQLEDTKKGFQPKPKLVEWIKSHI